MAVGVLGSLGLGQLRMVFREDQGKLDRWSQGESEGPNPLGFDLSPFRINLPIQTFSALNFRGECMLASGGLGGGGQESSMDSAQDHPGGEDGTVGTGLGFGEEKGGCCQSRGVVGRGVR